MTTALNQPIDTLRNRGRAPFKKDYQLPAAYEQELDRFVLRQGAKSAGTRRIYRGGAALLCAFLTQRWAAPSIEQINREHAQTFQDFLLQESGYARASIVSTIMGARLFCKALVDDDVIDADPFEKLPRVAPPPPPDVKILSRSEVQAIVDAARRDRSIWGARDVALICLLYSGGLRQQELLNLKRGDMDWARCTVSIAHGKGDQPRTIGLDNTAMLALDRYDRKRSRYVASLRPYRRATLAEGPIWLSRRGGALSASGLRRALEVRADQAGVSTPVHPHAWRHAAATHDAESMGDMELRDKFGWSPASAMPFRYTRQNLRARAIARSQRAGASTGLRI